VFLTATAGESYKEPNSTSSIARVQQIQDYNICQLQKRKLSQTWCWKRSVSGNFPLNLLEQMESYHRLSILRPVLSREQVCAVEAPTCLMNVPEQMKKIASTFTEYVRKSKYKVHDLVDHSGYWRQMVVRATRNNTAMVSITLCPQVRAMVENRLLFSVGWKVELHFRT